MDKRLYFEDFTAGQLYSLGARRITAEEIIDFAREFDPQPQHLDPEAAKASILGGLAASGWHLCAVAMRMIVDGLLGRTDSMGSPGVDDVQWRRPVYAGDDLRLDAEVLETRPSSRADRGYVRFRFTMSRVRGAERERVMLLMSSNIIGRQKEND